MTKDVKHKIKLWIMAATLGLVSLGSNTMPVEAASLAEFDAGYIISDWQMENYGSMSEAEIQNWLSMMNPCNNTDYNYYLRLSAGSNVKWHFENGHFVCLSEERFGENDGEIGFQYGETAAQIIWRAAQDYRINPQVLIVLLQKETGLITDKVPNSLDYRKAMGYGCSDSAACMTNYWGFKKQVRSAAASFRRILDGGWSNYKLGNNYIKYNTNLACGGSMVNIRSLATAALYNYTPYQPNAEALAAGYGTAPCGAYGNRNFYLYFQDWFGGITNEGMPSLAKILSVNRVADEVSDFELQYATHIQNYGWLPVVNGGQMAGTAGYGLQMEAMSVGLKSYANGGIEYQVHVANRGWLGYVRNGRATGTTGKGLQMEAVQIRLTGELAKLYDVYYRVHVQEYGWMGWTANDAVAGTTGQGKRIEALQVKIVRKKTANYVQYAAHVANIGWMADAKNGEVAGTTGRGLQMEALRIKLSGILSRSTVNYRAHVAGIGWMNWVKNGVNAGTTGRGLQMEAVEISLNKSLAEKYDIYYRAHVANIGWMDWVKNGKTAGTTGRGLRMEAMEIMVVKK